MTPEQLASTRAAHWREDGQPLQTLDDARTWLERMQLCLYLPRKTHVLAPAPSFVGAVLGNSSATPPPEAIQQAHDLLVRLVEEGPVVPLNLFGTPGEQPDFLILTTALPHLAALQPDRNWKKAPGRTGPGKVSPLAVEIWKLLEREGALTAEEIREQLGHELTEAATIRGLSELWQNLRVAPLPQREGQPAHWEILSVTHKKEMAAGGTMAQSTALSLLVSYYVQSVLTATAEDIEAFLSPIASRSRLRDVIRGLSATRQLRTLSMDAQTFLFIEGTLPEMPEQAAATEATDTPKPAFMGRSAYRERMLQKAKGEEEVPAKEDTSPRTYKDRHEGGSAERPRRAASSDRPRTGPSRTGPRRDETRERPSRFAAGGGTSRPSRPSFGDRARSGSDRTRPAGRPSFGDRPAGAQRPFRPRAEGERPRSEGRPFTPREGGRPPFRGKPAEGSARPFRPRTEGDRPRTGPPRGDRPFPGKDREGRPARTFTPRTPGTGSSGPRPARGDARPPFRGKAAEGGTRPFRPRGDNERPRSGPPRGDRPFKPRGDQPFKPGGDRPFKPGGDRPFTPRTDTRSSESRPFRPRPSSSTRPARPPFRGKSAEGRPAEGGSRPFRPRPAGDRPPFVRREGSSPAGRSSGRPAGRSGGPGGRPARGPEEGSGRPARRPGTPGRNPGGTGRPGGPRFGGSSRPRSGPGSGGPRSGAGRPATGRPAGPRAGSRPGGMRPPTRKPRPEGSRKPENDKE